jgi:hypothetical protein
MSKIHYYCLHCPKQKSSIRTKIIYLTASFLLTDPIQIRQEAAPD